MDGVRAFEWATVGLVLAVVVVAGPLVPGVTFSRAADPSGLGTGSATVEVVDAPDTVQIEGGDYGSEAYYLEVPDATVSVSEVTGRPLLAYSLTIRDLGLTRSTTHVLSEGSAERVEISLEGTTFPPGEITEAEYAGEVRIELRAEGDERELYRENVTVKVTE